jgi:aromatic ring-cleaving dioxygenase
MQQIEPGRIVDYHAHIYYEDAASRAIAAEMREAIAAGFDVVMGRWRDEPVGPHPKPMYQVAFRPTEFARLVPWLMLNHCGLSVDRKSVV